MYLNIPVIPSGPECEGEPILAGQCAVDGVLVLCAVLVTIDGIIGDCAGMLCSHNWSQVIITMPHSLASLMMMSHEAVLPALSVAK